MARTCLQVVKYPAEMLPIMDLVLIEEYARKRRGERKQGCRHAA